METSHVSYSVNKPVNIRDTEEYPGLNNFETRMDHLHKMSSYLDLTQAYYVSYETKNYILGI